MFVVVVVCLLTILYVEMAFLYSSTFAMFLSPTHHTYGVGPSRWTSHKKMILGNKCDMEEQRIISKERGKAIARENGISFLETSAKTNVNIEEAFFQICESILEAIPDARQHSTQPVPLTKAEIKSSSKCCSK